MKKKLALILLSTPSNTLGDQRYWLLWNKHLESPNFLGGHVEEGETFEQAASRELREELTSGELNESYGLGLTDEPALDDQLATLSGTLKLIGKPSQIAMFSLRAQRDKTLGSEDTVRQIQYLAATLDPERHPLVMQRLETLSQISVETSGQGGGDQARSVTPNIIVSLSTVELAIASRSWEYNPFVDYAFAIGALNRSEQNRRFRPWEADSLELTVQLQRALRRVTVKPGLPGKPNEQPFRNITVRVIERQTDPEGLAGRVASIELRQPQWPEEPIKFQTAWPEKGYFRELDGEPGADTYLRWVNVLQPLPAPVAIAPIDTPSNGGPVAPVTATIRHEMGRLAAQFQLTELRDVGGVTEPSEASEKSPDKLDVPTASISATNGEPEEPAPPKQTHSRALDPATASAIQEMLAQSLGLEPGAQENLDKDDLSRFYAQTVMAYWLHRINLRCVIAAACKDSKWAWRRLSKLLSGADYSLAGLRKKGLVTSLTAINGVDLAAQLAEVKRKDIPGDRCDGVSPKDRQLHPSHQGLLCLFETPDSPKIGITLHFTPGARVAGDGRLVIPTASMGHRDMMGLSAQLIPFTAHNDAARNTIGAKNLRQAVNVTGLEKPKLCTDHDLEILNQITPAGRALGLLNSEESFNAENILPGTNLLVAYMPWKGFNTDDAVVLSVTGAKKLGWTTQTRYVRRFKSGVSVNVLIKEQDAVGCHQILATLTGPDGTPLRPLRAQRAGIVKSLQCLKPPMAGLGGTLHIIVDEVRRLMPGDKLMGRYGNKGVVATILEDKDMPKLPMEIDGNQIEGLSDCPIEALLNPLGVISRMNLGQVMETQLTWATAVQARSFPATEPVASNEQKAVLQGQKGVKLVLPGGGTTQRPVAVGYQFFLRLRHSPADKGNYRGTPLDPEAYDPITGQPVRGRSHGGGQRLGEMEMWALAAQQADRVIQTMIGQRSSRPTNGLKPIGNSRVWESIRQHFFAVGCDLSIDGQKVKLEEISPVSLDQLPSYLPKQADAQIQQHPYATRWHCKTCGNSQVFRLRGDRASVRVFSTQRGNYAVTLECILEALGCQRELIDSLRRELDAAAPQDQLFEIALETAAAGQCLITYHPTRKSHKLNLKLPDDTALHFFHSGGLKNILELRWFCDRHPSGNGWLIPQPPFDLQEDAGDQNDIVRMALRLDDDTFCPILPVSFRVSQPDSLGIVRRTPLEEAYLRAHKAADTDKRPDRSNDERRQEFLYWREAAAQIAWHTLTGDFQHPQWMKSEMDDKGRAGVTRMLRRRPFGLSNTRPKDGLLRDAGLGRRVNESGRFVITPNPTLKISQAGIPMATAAVMWRQEIAAWLAEQDDIFKISDEIDVWSKDFDFQEFSPVPDVADEDAKRWDLMHSTLVRFLKARPGRRVLLNRQPSLHRSSMLAFEPVVLDWRVGWILQIHPLVCKGFNADFDGDEMVLHALSEELALSVSTMSPLHQTQRLSLSDGKPIMVNDQDAKLGEYVRGEKASQRFFEMLTSTSAEETLEDELGKWYLEQVERATSAGYSLTAGDLMAAVNAVNKKGVDKVRKQALAAKNAMDLLGLHEKLNDLADKALKGANTDSLGDLIDSDARAKKNTHPRQLWVSRGYLAPGALHGDPPPETDKNGVAPDPRFWCQSNLVDGLGVEDFFNAAYNGRSTLADKKLLPSIAGTITRQLVFHAWGWEVRGDCCGSSEPGPFHCTQSEKDPRSICRKCLRQLLFRQYPEGPSDGFPIGLVAAQIFGERGTQLSMQSFKGGGRQADPASIRRRIAELSRDLQALRKAAQPPGSANLLPLMIEFADELREVPAYKSVNPFWIQLLARILAHPEGPRGLDEIVGSLSRSKVALGPGSYESTPSTALLLGIWPERLSQQ